MSVRLLLDEDVHKRAAEQLRLRGYDAIHITEIGRTGLTDEEQLLFAFGEQRIIISFNTRDYVRLHKSFAQAHRSHAGIIASKQLPIGDLIKQLATLLHNTPSESFKDSLNFL